MTPKQKKLIENYVRSKVKSMLKEKRQLNEIGWMDREFANFEKWASLRANN